jgi:polysaccharide export outer membrane protein
MEPESSRALAGCKLSYDSVQDRAVRDERSGVLPFVFSGSEINIFNSEQGKRKSQLNQEAISMGEKLTKTKMSGLGMIRINRRSRRNGLFSATTCFVLSMAVWAQAAPPSNAPAPASEAPQAAPAQSSDVASSTKPHDASFMIGNDDVLAINVWKEPDISRSIPVRSDGKISLPLVGEVQATGQTPLKLEQEIAARLKSYIAEPEVTVIVQQINSQKFNILGQVTRPGSYPIANAATVLDAIAVAGGFRDFAKQKSIYILRQGADGSQTRLRFNYKEVVKGQNPAQNIKLLPRDTIVVP